MNGSVGATLLNPFPGLRPFREDEEHLFFGRESQVDTMVDKLALTRFLAVVGTSGSGKSSLVNSGLRPALHRGLMAKAGTSWRMVQFRPGGNPILAMARSMASNVALFGSYQPEGVSLVEIVEATLRMSKLGLVDIYEQAQVGNGAKLLVIVDQFEELFRYPTMRAASAGGEQDRNQEAVAFVKLLLEARSQANVPIYIVLTMRSDFLGDCSHFPGLAEAINEGQYLVPRLTREERRSAITGPVGVGGGVISPVLLTRLLNDVGDNPDQLSILQHALNRTWSRWQNAGSGEGPLSLPHYEAIGGMAHALDQHADKAYAELRNERQQEICEKIFKALTDRGTDARGIRRPTSFAMLCALAGASAVEVMEVIDIFRKPSRSFLMPPLPELVEPDSVIDISHESLMRIWERLKVWADEEAKSAQRYRRLSQTAAEHVAGKAGLLRDPELQLSLDWREDAKPNAAWASLYGGDFDASIHFLAESEQNRAKEKWEKEERQRRELEQAQALAMERARSAHRLRIGIGFVTVLAVIAGVAAVLAIQQRAAAEAARRIALGQSLLSQAVLIRETQPSKFDQAALLAIESLNLEPTAEADSILREALALLPKEISRFQLECDVMNTTLPPEGRFLACVDTKTGSVKVVSNVDGKDLARVPVAEFSEISALASSPDGKFLAIGFRSNGFKLFDTPSGQVLRNEGAGQRTTAVTFSAKGDNIATALFDQKTSRATIQLLSVADGSSQRYPIEQRVEGLTFSSDGRFLAALHQGGTNTEVTIFDRASGQRRTVVGGAATASLALSAGATWVALSHADNTVRVIDTNSGKDRGTLSHKMFARAVALSEDGTYVASGSEDGAAQVMEASSGRRVALVPGGSPVRAAAFTAGNHLVLLSADGTVRTVDFVNKPAFPVFQTVSGAVVGISPRGRYFTKFVNTPGENSTLNLEIIAGLTGRTLWQQVVPFELTDGVTRYSLDEKRFVATSLASGISVYDAETGQTLYHRPQTPGAVIQAISDDGKTVAWATANSIELFRLDNGRQERLEVPNIRLLNLSPDGKLVAAAGGGPFLAVLEAATKREIFRVQQGAPVTGTAFSSDGSYLASSSANNTLTLSEVFSGKVVWQLSNAATGALLLFSHDGRIVAAGGGSPPAFQLIDTRTRKTLSIIQIPREAEPVGAAFSSDGAYLDIADAASITRHYLRPKDLIEQACSLLTRNFAQDEWGAFMLGMKYRQTCPNHPS